MGAFHLVNSTVLLPGLSVVVPVYNSEESLPHLVRDLDNLRSKIEEVGQGFELILINDGSRDCTLAVVRELCAKYRWIRGVNLMRNYGQHNAVLAGIRLARYERTVTMDDDLQHPVDQIPLLLEVLDGEADLVYGVPKRLPHHPVRNILSRATKHCLAAVVGNRTVTEINAFRAIRTDVRKGFQNFQSPYVLLDVLLGWTTDKVAVCPVSHEERRYSKSNYTPLRLLNQFFILLTGYTTLPLRISTAIGGVTLLLGFFLLVYILLRTFIEGSIPGFPFLASITIIFGGVNLFCLGIIGEYLGRMFERTMDRPTYVVREYIEQESGAVIHETK